MQSKNLLLAALAITWIAAVESSLIFGAAIAGLAVLKGAAIVGFAAGRHNRRRSHGHYGRGHGHSHGHHGRRYGRSIEDAEAEESENLLLSTVGQFDASGCILKLLCNLQFKEEIDLTIQETILIDMFANNTKSITAYNAAFVYATDIGRENQDPSVCDKYFSQCPLNSAQLGGLLQQAWGCGFDILGDDTEGQEQQKKVVPTVPRKPIVPVA